LQPHLHAPSLHPIDQEVWTMTPEEWGLTAIALGVTAVGVWGVLKSANKRRPKDLEPVTSRVEGKPIIGKDGRIAGIIFRKRGAKR